MMLTFNRLGLITLEMEGLPIDQSELKIALIDHQLHSFIKAATDEGTMLMLHDKSSGLRFRLGFASDQTLIASRI